MKRVIIWSLHKLYIGRRFFFAPRGKYCGESCKEDENYARMCSFFADWHCRITDSDILFGQTSKRPMKDKDGCPFLGY